MWISSPLCLAGRRLSELSLAVKVVREAIDEVALLIPSGSQNDILPQLEVPALAILKREREGKTLLVTKEKRKLLDKKLKELVIEELTVLVNNVK